MVLLRLCFMLAGFAGLVACGQHEDGFTIAVRVKPIAGPSDALRRFPPNTPDPDRLHVRIVRLYGIGAKPLVDLDKSWAELEEDPVTTRKYLLIDVTANAGKDDPYILRLASQVGEDIDECGAVGPIVAERGQKVSVDVAPHVGDCQAALCAADEDCDLDSYCLSFECYEEISCTGDEVCPAGASCQEGTCSAKCLVDSDCPAGPAGEPFTCCLGFCASACFKPRA